MSRFAISIEKSTLFRGVAQHFSNTYVYAHLGLNPTPGTADSLIDEAVAAEKAFHSLSINFTFARCWSTGGTKQENQMITSKPLTGTGSIPTDNIDPERAILIQWKAGLDTRGKQVYLRKWYHTRGASMGGYSFSSDNKLNVTPFTTAQRQQIAGPADTLTRLDELGINVGLVAESGRERDPVEAPMAHKWYEHHQLGDEWRS